MMLCRASCISILVALGAGVVGLVEDVDVAGGGDMIGDVDCLGWLAAPVRTMALCFSHLRSELRYRCAGRHTRHANYFCMLLVDF